MINKLKNIKIGKKWQVFSVFVFFTGVLWFLNALNQEYTTEIKIPVNFYNMPHNKANVSELPKNFMATVKAYGYNILKFQLKKNFVPLKIDLSEVQFNHFSDNDTNRYYILTASYSDYIENELQANMTVEIIKPDTVYFQFTTYKEKYVPVIVNADIKAESQFTIKDNFILTPDSVLIGGPSIILDTITNVKTAFFSLQNLNKITNYVAEIQPISGLVISPPSINLTINIEEYTEIRYNIPIITINVPDSVELLLFPNYVNIVCKVGVNDYELIKPADFKVIVDYNYIYGNMGSQLETEIISYPDNIYEFYQTPEFVEYIIEKK
ncbi:MAG: YbbR-like domain-containing protein [Bacteroidales bacterium]|nr:YbbR-like domain-containing protein [Bacteroidales bacterium]